MNLDILAQSETATEKTGIEKPVIMVCRNGTEIGNTEALKGRAKRKTITQKLSLCLIDVASKKEDEERKQSFWNSYHCQSEIVNSNGRLHGKYCKNRICTLCCCIRKAEIINKYLAVVQYWDSPHFVTITVKSISAKWLKEVIDAMARGFKRIKNKYRKRAQRGKGFILMSIKSLECNFNPTTRKYNPHFHIIVPTGKRQI